MANPLARLAVVAAIALTALGAAAAAQATTYPVSTTAQLEAAIVASNAGPGADTINVAPGVYAPSDVLLITDELTINGSGLLGAVIDGSGLHDVFQVFDVFSGIHVTFNDLTISNGLVGIDYRCGVSSLLSVNRSTFVGNSLGVWVEGGPAEIKNSTLSGNDAGIEYEAGDPLTLTNDTIVDNTGSDGGFGNFGGPSTVRNTIIAHNLRGDCISSPPNAGDHNLASDSSCGPSAMTPADPKLGPLADNGGPTQTHALLPGSPAIDAGSNTGCLPIDQRGVARATCDVGAFEFIQPVVTFATSAGQLSNLSAVPEAILPTAGKPAGVTFPFGLFSWTVTGLTPGQTITVTMTYPSPVTSAAQYWKVIGGTWTNATSLLGSDDGDNVLTLTIRDGGPGDADGAMNGQISDPGGVAIPGSVADTTAPVITPSVACTLPGNAPWCRGDVSVSWSVVDNESTITSTSGCQPTVITTDTATAGTTLTCQATSAGGMASPQRVTIQRDATVPSIQGLRSPGANANGWNNSDVAVSFTCTDALSGIASCGPNQILSSEGANQSVTGTAVDKAGNSANTTVSGISIDKTAPVVQVTGVANGATYPFGSVPAAGCSTADALSGIAANAVSSLSGGNSLELGSFTASCGGASDKAGNTGAAAVNYTVTATPLLQTTVLIATVEGLPVPLAVKLVLKVPLLVAKAALQNNRPQVACGSLRVFEGIVRQLRQATKLTAAQATQLTGASQSIRTTLGCP